MGECSGYIFTPHLAKSPCSYASFGTFAPDLTFVNSTVPQVVLSGKTVPCIRLSLSQALIASQLCFFTTAAARTDCNLQIEDSIASILSISRYTSSAA